MHRSFDAGFINSVINHPSVREGAQVKGLVDISTLLLNRKNVLLQNEYGGFLVLEKMPGIYECHTQFLPEGRGQQVRDCVRSALRYMFINTDCMRIITTASHSAAIKLSREFFTEKGSNPSFKYFSLNYEDWVEGDEDVRREGRKFHDMIGDKKNHEDDDTHDSHVGAAAMMFKSGNAHKGQNLYNQWAIMSGYELVFIENMSPLIVKNKDFILTIENGEIVCQ